MNRKLSLPERPSALFLLAVVDVIAVLLIFFTLVPVVAQQAGFRADFSNIPSRVPPYDITKATYIYMTPGTPPGIKIGFETVRMEELEEVLTKQAEGEMEWAMITADEHIHLQDALDVGFIAARAGLNVMYGGDLAEKMEERSGAE